MVATLPGWLFLQPGSETYFKICGKADGMSVPGPRPTCKSRRSMSA